MARRPTQNGVEFCSLRRPHVLNVDPSARLIGMIRIPGCLTSIRTPPHRPRRTVVLAEVVTALRAKFSVHFPHLRSPNRPMIVTHKIKNPPSKEGGVLDNRGEDGEEPRRSPNARREHAR